MSERFLKNTGTTYINKDLKRLKKWKSLSEDIVNFYNVFDGACIEEGLENVCRMRTHCGDFIASLAYFDESEESIWIYKVRVPITKPPLSKKYGARLVYGIVPSYSIFVPLLVYSPSEKGQDYPINGKKFPLTSKGLGHIVAEKLLT